MQFLAFHLMPYGVPEIHDAVAETDPPSAWVTLSNKHYDPKKGVELYRRYLDELTWASQVGFDGVSVNEHHQNAYGTMPNPNLMAAALIERIPDGDIAILGNAIPLHDPLLIAEQIAMLDILSGGRIISGFVRGIGFEYTNSEMNPNESRERFEEAHDLIIRSWTERGPFAWHGRHYHREHVNPWPRPLQQPHPRVWMPSQGSAETVEWTAERRYVYVQTFTKLSRVASIAREFRAGARKHGYESKPEQLGIALPVYVGETDEKAREEYKPHVESFVNDLLQGPIDLWFPPGYLNPASQGRVIQSRGDLFSHNQHRFEDLERDGFVVVGDPDTVADKLSEVIDVTGAGIILPFIQLATMDHEMTMASITRLGEEVLPRLRDFRYSGRHEEEEVAAG